MKRISFQGFFFAEENKKKIFNFIHNITDNNMSQFVNITLEILVVCQIPPSTRVKSPGSEWPLPDP